MKLNVWQAEALAKAMRDHADPDAPDLNPYYAEVELRHVEDDDHRDVLVIVWEDGTRLVLGDNYANHFTPIDPVRADQSKYVDHRGTLRYSADHSEVYPGPTGVRRGPDSH